MFSPNTKEAAANTANSAKETYRNAKSDMTSNSEAIKGDLSDMAANAGKQVRNLINDASSHLSDASQKITSEVRSNPMRSSLVALGIGFVVGLLCRR